MGLTNFNQIISYVNEDINKEIIRIENELFRLRFKKGTKQAIKTHEIKHLKRYLAQLKTLLTLRIKNDKKEKIT